MDGLCYSKCPEGMWRVPGMPYLCSASFDKRSQVMTPHGAVCPDNKTNIAGLCYTRDEDMPKGYIRKAIGTLDQVCPDPTSSDVTKGNVDMGVFCLRQSAWRDTAGVPFDMKFKDRK